MTRIVFKVSLLIGFLCLLLDPQGLWGQSFKPLGFQLPEEGIIDVSFDYSESTLAGFQFDKYVKLHKDFDDRKQEAEGRFIEALNEQLREKAKLVGRDRFQLGKGKSRKHGTDLTIYHRIEGIVFLQDDEDMVFKLVLKPSTITDKGYFNGHAVIIDMDGQIVGEFNNLEGKGGVYGSFYNLMGDGYESVAEKIAGLIVSALNKGII
ncbi:MAG: hypothetical protein IJL91_12470 [Bacteroidales bacterium]|nr:hypothetical protein [Bacteroidales bacterium]